MSKEEEIRKYYEEDFKLEGMPEFESLSFDQKLIIYEGNGFNLWKLRKALGELKKAILVSLGLSEKTPAP